MIVVPFALIIVVVMWFIPAIGQDYNVTQVQTVPFVTDHFTLTGLYRDTIQSVELVNGELHIVTEYEEFGYPTSCLVYGCNDCNYGRSVRKDIYRAVNGKIELSETIKGYVKITSRSEEIIFDK